MKKAVLLLCLLCCFAFLAIVGWPMQTLSFSEIPVVSDAALSDLASARGTLPFDLLTVNVHDVSLPRCSTQDAWYSPALTEEILASFPHPFRMVRTKTADGTCRLLIYTGTVCAEYRLVETGLPVISINLRRFDLDPRYIGTSRTPAAANILSLAEDGTLQWQTDRIEIKARGDSSRQFYPKTSYTLFFLDETGNAALRTPLRLPADRKFALNALYEDDSKIRDALAFHVSRQISPDHALQLAYAELILNEEYYGLYGMHQIITENVLHTETADTVYKINSGSLYVTVPANEVAVGDPTNSVPLERFFSIFSAPIDALPAFCDRESFVDYVVTMEIIANTDARLKNMVFVHRAVTDKLQLVAWDMDLTFGFAWLDTPPLYFGADASLTEFRYTAFSPETQFEPLGILYESCPDFAEDVAARYRELRKTVLTDEALLQKAADLYDPLTACGARQRDAVRWPESAISSDNSFIETFIPARMAFLDKVFGTADGAQK